MASERFKLALDQVGPDNWREFEVLAAEFLVTDYPSLRTMAASTGDKGRDGELFSPSENSSSVAIQYSVAENWKDKISKTLKRLEETMPNLRTLIYVTNQRIGPSADELKRKIQEKGITVDVRDQSWFLERELTSPQRQVAAAELAERFVDPLLSARGVKQTVATVLDDSEAQVALLHLALDVQDKATDKGLTKTSFETLVIAALEGTTSDRTIGSDQIIQRVCAMMPSGNPRQVQEQATSALRRLTSKGGPVHFHKSSDSYCLSHEKATQVRERMAEYVNDETSLELQIKDLVNAAADGEIGAIEGEVFDACARNLRGAIEQLLLEKGEAFAGAVSSGRMVQLDAEQVRAAVVSLVPTEFPVTVEQAVGIIVEVMQRPLGSTRRHLRRLADAYTLFAFLRQVPDVQKTIVKLFDGGHIWLDTTVILPMLAETLILEPSERPFTVLLKAARESGIQLFVTSGIVEEVERHINRSLTFARGTREKWRGSVPFLYGVFALSGRSRASFSGWTEEFRGDVRPEDDVAEALWGLFRVGKRDLLQYSDAADLSLRGAVQEVWQEAHDRRRGTGANSDLDSMTVNRLVAHDVENCVGVIQLRKGQPASPVGYRSWFLTMDRTAFSLVDELPRRIGPKAPGSPIISPDFLSEFLRLGSLRTAIDQELRVNLPVVTDLGRFGNFPVNLVETAEEIRRESGEISERLIRRRVRDTLDAERLRLGVKAYGGLSAVREEFASKFG
ncbi:hypothetical protein [Nakamurella multipartita]|uniref:Uncharacterized protein n=1 Tax=Nakamurella multipartita (strain ATCC 700099 / DSM 44233 / CIP 104796 / JCM 9543 / NBRC 105858 / Y-104) TaxID=479431 RepID=C8X788_NAKMY|nr:hypothetical protein [Nakamurella multipartita]ACV76957.1 hypothetical protein Namu_0541 [Nakamurella multipartita DSM 44233]